MSIVRIGLGETKNFTEGYSAIFGKKKTASASKAKKPRVSSKSKKRKKK